MTHDELKAAHAAGAWIYGIEDDGKLHRIEDPQWLCPADRYVALVPYIAELGQEVGAEQIGWVREVTWVDGRNMTIYENEPKPLVNPMAGFVSQRIVPVFTSPAHTSEARDAARYRWLRDTPGIQTFICGFAGHSRISGVYADVEIDAAMRQEES